MKDSADGNRSVQDDALLASKQNRPPGHEDKVLPPDDSTSQRTYATTRRWRRHKISVPIRVILSHPEKTTFTDGRGNELSEGGLALTAGVELRPDDQITVEFTPPYSSGPIRVEGIVRNREGYRYGVEFIREGPEAKIQVDRLCRMLSVLTEA